MSPKHLKLITLICGPTLTLFFYFHHFTQTQLTKTKHIINTQQTKPRARAGLLSTLLVPPRAFYQTIIDNNLFRPLGWQPVRPKASYRLLGSLIPTDEETQPRAILQTTTRTQHTIIRGEMLGNFTLIDIQPKRVTLEKTDKCKSLNSILHSG